MERRASLPGEIIRRGSKVATDVFLGPTARKGSAFSSRLSITEEGQTALLIVRIHFFGALSFIISSAAFVHYTRAHPWLYWYRIGCITFIPGCFAYLWAAALNVQSGSAALSSKVSDVVLGLAMLLYLAGCGIALRGEEKDVNANFDRINWFFLVGSVAAFVDALKCSFSASITDGISFANILDLAATSCFVAGAILAGGFYRLSPETIREGMILWFLGSCFCIVGPARVVYERFARTSPMMDSNATYGSFDSRHRRRSNSCASDGWTDLNAPSEASEGSGPGTCGTPKFKRHAEASPRSLDSAGAVIRCDTGNSCDEGRVFGHRKSKDGSPGAQSSGRQESKESVKTDRTNDSNLI